METNDSRIPPGATSFCPRVTPLSGGSFQGRNLRHTVRPAGTRDWLLIYTLRGSGCYRSGESVFHSQPHDITLFSPGAFQDYQASPRDGWDLLYVHYLARLEWMDWLDWPERIPGTLLLSVSDVGVRRRVLKRLRDAIQYSLGGQLERQRFGQNALEEVLLWCRSVNLRNNSHAADARVQKAAEMLCMQLDQPFSEDRLARAAGLSASRLRHLFTAQMGEGPRRYHERQKLIRAQHLLIFSQRTVSQIAGDLGFENPFYFTLRFKKETGMSPRDFRKRALG